MSDVFGANHGYNRTETGVIETIFLDWALALGAGLLFGLAGRGEVADAPSLARTRAFRWGLLYLHLGVIAISATLYAIEPAWMWMYWVDPSTLPIVVVVLSFLVYELCYIAGFAIARELEQIRRNATWALVGVMGTAITAAEVATRVRLFHFGTFEEFAAGKAPLGIDLEPFRLEPAMAIVLGPGLIATAAIVGLTLRIWRADRQRLPSPPGLVAPAEAAPEPSTP